MHRIRVVVLIFVIGFSAFTQTVNISGKVTNQNGNPIAGAVVELTGQDLKDTTDDKGAYNLLSTVAVNSAPLLAPTEKITVNRGIISLNLTETSRVLIELFDIHGNLLDRVLDDFAPTGIYQCDVTRYPYASLMMMARVSIGDHSSVFRFFPLRNKHRVIGFPATIATADGGGFAKLRAVVVDTLKVTAANYHTSITVISSYEGGVNITLDSVMLDKFSFFVTSLASLQELSGSKDGFGGDLRFGKTGPGAGLLGADSICECIAEMSMPGSRVKQWRAFLSVSKGPDGTPVNAIDRIGKGPWYDRMGRLFANNISELLNARPENADPDIKNDFPNEFGIPNHRPDPNEEEADNHHFITGSDKEGKLYNPTATCADWTTTDSNSIAGRPQCGFSWPRSTRDPDRFHWISGLSVHGCGAGIQITEQNGGVGAVIGAGGGYGGFYCFALTP